MPRLSPSSQTCPLRIKTLLLLEKMSRSRLLTARTKGMTLLRPWIPVFRTQCHVPWTTGRPSTGQGRRSRRSPGMTGGDLCRLTSAKRRIRRLPSHRSTILHWVFPTIPLMTVYFIIYEPQTYLLMTHISRTCDQDTGAFEATNLGESLRNR